MENQQKDQTFGVYEKNGGVCSLKAINYLLDITDFNMKKTVVQEFENARDKPVEMVYKFCDTNEQTINFIEVELYDPEKDERRVLKAKIEEKKKAQEKYDDAIADGSSAMLAEKDDDDRVTLNLGNILPKVQVTVKMDSVEEVKVEKALTINNDLTMKIKIPSLNYSGGQFADAVDNLSVECRVKLSSTGRVTKMTSTSHKNAFEAEIADEEEDEASTGSIRTTKKVSFNRDIDLEITVSGAPLASGLIEQTGEEDHVAALNIVPNFDEDVQVQTELVIIIDCSGSMSGARMRYAKAAMTGFVDAIHDKSKENNIKMNVVRFGSNYNALFPDVPKTLDDRSFRQIKAYLDETTSNMGGTDILAPVRHVLNQKVSDGYTRQVFLLTDGEDHNTERIIKFVRNNARTTRFFSFGIGAGINPVLIERVADSSLGRAVFLSQNAEIQDKVMAQLEYALQPAVQDISVEFDGTEGQCVTERVPACYNLQKQSLYYFLKGPSEKCEISYTVAGKNMTQSIPLASHKGGLFLGSVAAKKRVRELETAYEDLGMTQVQAENGIRDLGMKYHFLTTQTSFLMVAENEDDAIMDDLDTESIQAVQRKVEEEEEEEPEPRRNYQRVANHYNDQAADRVMMRAHAPRRGGGGGGGWGNAFSIGGCVDSDSQIRVLLKKKGKKDDEEEESEGEEEYEVKKLSEVEQGDYVEAMSESGELEYSLVIERVNHQSERRIIQILLEDGRELKLTRSHLIPYCKTARSDCKKYYKGVVAKKVKVGGYVLIKDVGGQIVRPMRVKEVREGKCMVSIVYTNNTTMVVNDIVCSVFTSQKMFKLFYYYKKLYWNTPEKVRVPLFKKACDTFVHAVFVKERYKFF